MSRKKVARKVLAQVSLDLLKTAATYDDIVSGLEPKVKEEAKDVQMTMTDEDESSNTYTFESTTGHTTKIQLDPRSDTENIESGELLISCSCPYWQYYGPEYYAKKDNYLKGDPRGTASKPDVNDPEGDNYLCKHAYKALESLV